MKYSTTLPTLPETVQSEDNFFSLAFNYGATDDQSHLMVNSSEPDLVSELANFFLPYRKEGEEYLKGHSGYFYLALPHPGEDKTSACLHIAVPFIDIEDLEAGSGVEQRQDFDRLMDIVQQVITDMVDANILEPGQNSVDIVTEPLSASGELEIRKVDWASFAIGATWLTAHDKSVFSDYRWWDPEKGSWKNSE